MKKAVITALWAMALTAALSAPAFARELVLGGQVVGIQISTEGVLVSELARVDTEGGSFSPAEDAGVRQGDFIIQIGDTKVSGAGELIAAVEKLDGKPAELTVRRNERTMKFSVQPVRSGENQWLMGMWLRDGISGIGTVTYIDPSTGSFGALGHSISDMETGATVSMRSGNISKAEIVSITRGTAGTPGELNGCADVGCVIGSVEKNTENGIYGRFHGDAGNVVMDTGDICPGDATVICTVEGGSTESYAVEINRVYENDGCSHVILTVTDRKLLSLTGGIVQGMSGSPIVQNGKIVGAVTHVFVNDPTRGYGISITDMLASAGIEKKAA